MAPREVTAAGTRPPGLARLTAGLTEVLGGAVTVLRRQRNVRSSTAASEVLTCRLPGGATGRLLAKYGSADDLDETYGHKGGVPFEAAVYRQVLAPFRDRTVPYRGACPGARPGETWLFCDYLAGALLLQKVDGGLALGARWAGHFHRANEGCRAAALSPLRAYDRRYYRGWVERTVHFAGGLRREMPWLVPLCRRFAEAADLLLAAPQTVIHGEYYPHNILESGGKVYPIDWESAAVAAGEIDIACLAEGWEDRDVAECERVYREARWPGGPPHRFGQALAAARLYVALRWLGDRPEWTRSVQGAWYFGQLRRAGGRLGLI
jgi:hypothetical protein